MTPSSYSAVNPQHRTPPGTLHATAFSCGMGKSNGHKGGPRRGAGSFFANLPQDLKSQLRSQTFPEPAVPAVKGEEDSVVKSEVCTSLSIRNELIPLFSRRL